MLYVTDKRRKFALNAKQAIQLELKLNVTQYGHSWSTIGDELYNYGIAAIDTDKMLVVSEKQYEFLVILISNNGVEECSEL